MSNINYKTISKVKCLFTVVLLLSLGLQSCRKIETTTPLTPIKDPNLIEEYTYDPSGVVFKIVDDVEHAWNYQEYRIQPIDSICLSKFEYIGSVDSMYTKNYTWFTKKGQYVYWRYKYIHEGGKHLTVIFPNIYRRHVVGFEICGFTGYIDCNINSSRYNDFQFLFPLVNDTVQMRLSNIWPGAFLDYK